MCKSTATNTEFNQVLGPMRAKMNERNAKELAKAREDALAPVAGGDGDVPGTTKDRGDVESQAQ